MPHALIVHAHPEPQSFNAAMRTQAVDTLQQLNYTVSVSDLYAMRFKAVADGEDFTQRANPDYLVYALEQRTAFTQGTLAPDVAAELEKIRQADLIILNFPMYWFSLPAILKGWIDRVFVSGFCYGGRRVYDRGGLAGKSAMLAFSLGGREHMFGPGAIHGDMDSLLRPIQQGMLAYTGLTVLPPFIAYHVPYISQEARQQCLANYDQHLRTLDQRPPLLFPSVADFDDQFRPFAQQAENIE